MSNPFFNAMGGRQQLTGLFGNIQFIVQLVQQFMEFRKNFKGNPKAEVDKLLQTGQINQDQLNQAQQLASQIQSFFK